MPKAQLLCPLCGVIADTELTPGNLYVRCPCCGWFRLTYLAHERYFGGNGSRVIDTGQRRRLGAYVKRRFAESSDTPVELSINVIRELLWIEDN